MSPLKHYLLFITAQGHYLVWMVTQQCPQRHGMWELYFGEKKRKLQGWAYSTGFRAHALHLIPSTTCFSPSSLLHCLCSCGNPHLQWAWAALHPPVLILNCPLGCQRIIGRAPMPPRTTFAAQSKFKTYFLRENNTWDQGSKSKNAVPH